MKPTPFDQIGQPLREVLTLPLSEALRAGLALRDAGSDVPKVSADIHGYVELASRSRSCAKSSKTVLTFALPNRFMKVPASMLGCRWCPASC
ncbi:hypothetical protein [Bradyrhizobium liaoningense]|uniref:hypothetical protein n=1 Tax=Bradyrhizobium liaoningense TaxID=43992 RepID=UPI001BAC0435|nr:hypothetical protein [Bradyrhizobium liaoningense]MBR0822410.1 hypothetical protein [Bradyrhizobium liaoningense]